MSKKWFWMRALVMLVIVGLLVVGGVALYRAGWSQGYVASPLVVEGEEAETLAVKRLLQAPFFSWR